MTCATYADVDIAERYVLGQMKEPEQAAFEEHFFGCDACLASVQTLQQMQAALKATPRVAATELAAEMAAEMAAHEAVAAGSPSTGRGSLVNSKWLGLALAASLLLGLTWWAWRQPVADTGSTMASNTEPTTPPVTADARPAPPTDQRPAVDAPPSDARPPNAPQPEGTSPSNSPVTPRPAPRVEPAKPRDLGLLALIVPPPYVPLQTRGSADSQAQAFAAAMTRYSAKDYQAAATELRTLAQAQPEAAHVQFFLGISLLMADQAGEARQALERAAASGTAPFADESHFYLAKVALRERDLTRAERELQLAIEREAGPAGEAEKLLRELRSR
jgi:hypothetical protein